MDPGEHFLCLDERTSRPPLSSIPSLALRSLRIAAPSAGLSPLTRARSYAGFFNTFPHEHERYVNTGTLISEGAA